MVKLLNQPNFQKNAGRLDFQDNVMFACCLQERMLGKGHRYDVFPTNKQGCFSHFFFSHWKVSRSLHTWIQGGPTTSCKWSYNPYKWLYKWATGVITLLIEVITPFIASRGPPCHGKPSYQAVAGAQHQSNPGCPHEVVARGEGPKKKTRWNQTAWKAKCPIFKAIVAGFRGKVAKKNRTLGVPGGKKPWDIHEFHDINTGATGRMSPHHPMVCILPINNNPSETREQLV